MEILHHVSFDPINEFVLRVPDTCAPQEDNKTPRVCLSEYVNTAIQAMPHGGRALRGMLLMRNKITPLLNLYVTAYDGQCGFVPPNELMKKHGVCDAVMNSEWWAIDTVPKLEHRIIKIFDANMRDGKGMDGTTGVYVDDIEYDILHELPSNAPELFFGELGCPIRSAFKLIDDHAVEWLKK
jgi:hypothetical protein